MRRNIFGELSALDGYAGHVEISVDFQLTENTTTQSDEMMAELCGLLIGYLKARVSSVEQVSSISVVSNTSVFFTCASRDGYLLVQFLKNGDFSKIRDSVCSILSSKED